MLQEALERATQERFAAELVAIQESTDHKPLIKLHENNDRQSRKAISNNYLVNCIKADSTARGRDGIGKFAPRGEGAGMGRTKGPRQEGREWVGTGFSGCS